MTKRRFFVAIVAYIIGDAIGRYLRTKYLQPEVPRLSPQLQAWADYVEKYPTLEDDPKIKRALEVLEQDRQNHPE